MNSACFKTLHTHTQVSEKVMETKLISIPEKYKERYDSNYLSELIETKDHVDILNWIREEKLSLQSFTDTEPKRTLMRQILNEAENGDEIVKEILDSFVTKIPVGSKKISLNSYNIKVDFSGIIRENNGKQQSVLKDLVQLWLSYKTTPLERIVQRCKGSKKMKKKKSSSKIILGKTIMHLDNAVKSNNIFCRYDVPSSTDSLYQTQMGQGNEILPYSHSSVPLLPDLLLFVHLVCLWD